jgi:methylmalonyl-CoA mutase N-terminal domain/subunit
MWANIMKELGARDPRSMMLRFHTQTGGSTLMAQQPMNNISRVTLQALSAVLGGTQSLHTNGYDEALSLPTEEAARLALRTQQVIAHESGVIDTVDPLAGSYFVETLTDELEAKAWEYIHRIDGMGGAVNAIESGFMQNEIAHASYEYLQSIEKNERIIVGLNAYQMEEKTFDKYFVVDDSIRKVQADKLNVLKSERDADKTTAALAVIKAAAKENTNLMPGIIAAVENNATLGEISDVMRRVFGEYR